MNRKWKSKLYVLMAMVMYRIILPCQRVLANEKAGVKEVTDGIGIIETISLTAVQGVGVVFIAWGLMDFGAAYSDHQTSAQHQSIKKVVGGIVMLAVPGIVKLFV